MAHDFGFEPVDKSYYFVSYCGRFKKPLERAAAICRELNDNNVPLWYDRAIPYGEKYAAVISRQVERSRLMLLFVSSEMLYKSEGKEDSYVLVEFDIARRKKKKIIPIFLDDVDGSMVHHDFDEFYSLIRKYQGIKVNYDLSAATVALMISDILGHADKGFKEASAALAKERETEKQRAAQNAADAAGNEAPNPDETLAQSAAAGEKTEPASSGNSGEKRSVGWRLAGNLNIPVFGLLIFTALIMSISPENADVTPGTFEYWVIYLMVIGYGLIGLCSSITCFMLYDRKKIGSIVTNGVVFFNISSILLLVSIILTPFYIDDYFALADLISFNSIAVFAWKLAALVFQNKNKSEKQQRILHGIFAGVMALFMLGAVALTIYDIETYTNSLSVAAASAVPMICIPCLMKKKYHTRFWGVTAVLSAVFSVICFAVILRIYRLDSFKNLSFDIVLTLFLFANIIPLLVATPIVCLSKKPL